ncbi:MAG: hypothetical protein DRP61_05350, partial [Candidatus Omnitrophota bacterium]
ARADSLINLYERTHLDVRTVLGIEGILANGNISLLVGDPDYLDTGSIGGYGDSLNLYLTDKIESTLLGGTVDIDVPYGGIYDNNAPDLDVISTNLDMLARDAIGTSSPNGRIDTQVDDLWALATAGDIWINEFDGVNLWDIQALGSTVDIITGGDTYAYNVLATGSGPADPARVNLDINSGSLFVDGTISAQRSGDGVAIVGIDAEQGINTQDSVIEAIVEDEGHAAINMNTAGNLVLNNSNLLARVNRGLDSAIINLIANGYIGLDASTVQATSITSGPTNITFTASDIFLNNGSVVRANSLGNFLSRIYFDAEEVIRITDSRVVTNELNYGGLSRVRFDASNIGLIRSEVISRGLGTSAWISFNADNNIMILDDSLVSALSKFAPSTIGGAYIGLHADEGSVTINNSTVRAIDPNDVGVASVNITAGQDVNIENESLVKAKNFLNGESRVNAEAGNDIEVKDSSVEAELDDEGDATVDLNAGNDIRIENNSTIQAFAGEEGYSDENTATVDFYAQKDILVKDGSTVTAEADSNTYDGAASAIVDMESENGKIEVKESTVEAIADAQNDSNADIEMWADTIRITNSPKSIHAEAISQNGYAESEIKMRAYGWWKGIFVKNSEVKATSDSRHGDAKAELNLDANNNGSIEVTEGSLLKAKSNALEDSKAKVRMTAEKDILVKDSSRVIADAKSRGRKDKAHADIYMESDNGKIEVKESLVNAIAYGVRRAMADIGMWANNLKITKSDIIADADTDRASRGHVGEGGAYSEIKLRADESDKRDGGDIERAAIDIKDSLVEANTRAIGRDTKAEVNMGASDGSIRVANSTVKSDAQGIKAKTMVRMNAYKDIIVTDSPDTILAHSYSARGRADADVLMNSENGKIEIKNSEVLAEAEGKEGADAYTEMKADTIRITNSPDTVLAEAVSSNSTADAKVYLRARDDGIYIKNSRVRAKADGRDSSESKIVLHANKDIEITEGSELKAKTDSSEDDAKAIVKLEADNGKIEVKESRVKASSNSKGRNAQSRIEMTGDNIRITNSYSSIISEAKSRYGHVDANIYMRSHGNKGIFIKNSRLLADAEGQEYSESNIHMEADQNITIDPSTITAYVDGEGHAEVDMSAGDSINIIGSIIQAESGAESEGGGDTALVTFIAGGDITIDEASSVNALSHDESPAAVLALAGGSINAYGEVSAISEEGLAGVVMGAIGDVFAGNVSASGGADGISLLEGFINDMFGVSLDIQAQYGSGIFLGSLAGDITLGDLSADMVLATALGLDGDGSIKDVGDVNAHFLGLLARNNIGTVDNPINTDVDILTAYSWDSGDIYINEKNSIELGVYLPVSVNGNPAVSLGFSVAANDGIIHITSAEDMIVNSVISPRGGVFLETTGGSIYAGQGWCPIISQADINSLGLPTFIQNLLEQALMDVKLTDWGTIGGIDYFSPIMVGFPDMPAGPNVISGGASYFSAPSGTIGVGSPVDPESLDNPLRVCIQVIEGSH